MQGRSKLHVPVIGNDRSKLNTSSADEKAASRRLHLERGSHDLLSALLFRRSERTDRSFPRVRGRPRCSGNRPIGTVALRHANGAVVQGSKSDALGSDRPGSICSLSGSLSFLAASGLLSANVRFGSKADVTLLVSGMGGKRTLLHCVFRAASRVDRATLYRRRKQSAEVVALPS